MQDLWTKEWKFHGFFVRHIIYKDCIFYNTRICRINTVNICPEFYTFNTQGCTNNCSRKVRTIAAQEAHYRLWTGTTRPGTDKAWEQKYFCLGWRGTIAERSTGFVTGRIICFSFFLVACGKYKFAGIKENYTLLFCKENIFHNRCRQKLAHSHYAAVNCIRTFTKRNTTGKEFFEFFKIWL